MEANIAGASGGALSSPPALDVTTGPRRYMSKTQRACDFCRSRKSACQIQTAPPCRLCVAHSKICTFERVKPKRRSPSKRKQALPNSTENVGVVSEKSPTPLRPLETPAQSQQREPQLMEYEFNSLDWNDLIFEGNGESYNTMDFDLSSLVDEQPQPTLSAPVDSSLGFDHMMDDFHSNFFDEIFKDSSELQTNERSLDQLPNLTAQLCGLTGDMDPYMLRRYRYNENGEFRFSKLSIRTVQDSALPAQFLLSPADLSKDSRAEAELANSNSAFEECDKETLSELVPDDIGERLIELFFRFINPQFPILSKANPPDPANAPVHVLASIYCTAGSFATFDDRLCIDFAYNGPPSQKLFNLAWRSLNRSIHEPTIATVQASLILLLYPPANELVLDSAFKWSLLGSLVSTSQTIGLHLDANHWRLPLEERLLRKRLSWAVYTFDKWFALSLGRPSHIMENNWLVQELTASDLEAEYAGLVPGNVSTCLPFSRLTRILDRVLVELYSLKSVAVLTSDYKATLSVARDLLQELTSWYQNLDSSFHFIASEDLSSNPDPTCSIHLCYHAVKITILRALLRPFYHAGASPPNDPHESAEWVAARIYCRLGANTGASAAIRSISLLRACHYQAFWPPWCKTNFALIPNLLFLLAVTSPAEEAASALNSLNQARQVFRIQSRSFSMVRFALLRIDAVFWVGLSELINKKADESPNVS